MTTGPAAPPAHAVEAQAEPRPLLGAEPADPRAALEAHVALGQRNPAMQPRVVRESSSAARSAAKMSSGSPDSAAQRNGPAHAEQRADVRGHESR